MTEIYECSVCGVVTHNDNDVCRPEPQEDIHDYCSTTRERGAPCHDIREQLPVVCGNCGRPARQADLVCNPLLLG